MVGRVVLNHSTHVEGLIPWLTALSLKKGIGTITPGVISRSKGRSEAIKIRITSEIKGGYKLIARRGRSAQEVFLLSKLNRLELIKLIIETRPKR